MMKTAPAEGGASRSLAVTARPSISTMFAFPKEHSLGVQGLIEDLLNVPD